MPRKCGASARYEVSRKRRKKNYLEASKKRSRNVKLARRKGAAL